MGGTILTLIGLGFADYGAKVGFHALAEGSGGDDRGGIFVAATMAHAAFRGRVLTCRTPPMNASGSFSLRLTPNGIGDEMSRGALRFTYYDDQLGDTGSGDANVSVSG